MSEPTEYTNLNSDFQVNPFGHQPQIHEYYEKYPTIPEEYHQFFIPSPSDPSKVICKCVLKDGQICNREIKKNYEYSHLITHFDAQYACKICWKWYKREASVKTHIESKHFHTYPLYFCGYCGKKLSTKYTLARHTATQHSF
mmetsp:Transcript_66048/g.59314  ORF Transcript_66048/g.59314 Transcript_66048/m.59314 type:complete len:142 (-) Transcript_66048:164-589(-)